MNFTANGLLAIGASPIMADAIEEVADIVQLADGLLVNIGTLNARTVAAMHVAMDAAAKKGIPIVFDPVGAGASSYRLETARQFLAKRCVTLLRCNAGELAAIAGVKWQASGVDCGKGDANMEELAKKVALRFSCLVVVTGEQDVVTDGETLELITGGHQKVTQITGMGCLLSAICTALLATSEQPLKDLKTLLTDYKTVAEKALAPLGTYQLQFVNELERMSEVTQ